MEAWKWWDRSMHYLFSADPQAFLDLLLGKGQVRYLAHLPEKLEGDRAIVDTLLDTEIVEDGSFLLVHLESETRKDSNMESVCWSTTRRFVRSTSTSGTCSRVFSI